MWWSKKEEAKMDFSARCEKLEGKLQGLYDERVTLKEQVEDLKIEKKTSEEDIKHMVKMKEERLDIEFQKKVMELERKKQEEVAKVKDDYRDKLETNLVAQKDDIKDMYGEILERLPNINARLRIDQKE